MSQRAGRWPRKNTPDQIAARQDHLRGLPHWDSAAHEFLWQWPQPPERLALVESLTSHVVLPVSVVGPIPIELGEYQLDEDGQLVQVRRSPERVFVPLAHTEGGLSASLQRGIAALVDAGANVRTYVLRDRMTRDSCFLFDSAGEAVACADWIRANASALRAWLHDPKNPLYSEQIGGVARLSRHARLWEIDLHVLGGACHVLYRFTTGDACGPNMITRNAFASNQEFILPQLRADTGLVPRRVLVEANMGGDKKPSAQYFVAGGHGKTVLAEAVLPSSTLRRVLRVSADDLLELEHLAMHGGLASQMQSVAFTPASVVAAMFAATGQDLGMVGTSSMAHDVVERAPGGDGLHLSIRFAGLEVGTVGGGTGLLHARAFLALLGCTGEGGALRLAQIVAAAALCLEISAAASAATAGSENFVLAHLTRSGRS